MITFRKSIGSTWYFDIQTKSVYMDKFTTKQMSLCLGYSAVSRWRFGMVNHIWIPFPQSTKQDQILIYQYQQLIISLFHWCVWALMSSSGSSYFQLFRVPPGRKLAVSGCFSATGGAVQVASPARVIESNSAIQRISLDTQILHLKALCTVRFQSRSGMCSKAANTWDLAHQVWPSRNACTQPSQHHRPLWVIQQKTEIRSCSSSFLKSSHVISSGGIGPQPDISHCFRPRC